MSKLLQTLGGVDKLIELTVEKLQLLRELRLSLVCNAVRENHSAIDEYLHTLDYTDPEMLLEAKTVLVQTCNVSPADINTFALYMKMSPSDRRTIKIQEFFKSLSRERL